MPVAILPNPPVSWDVYVSGPWVNNSALTNSTANFINDFVVPGYSPESHATSSPRQLVTLGVGGTGVVTNVEYYRGVLVFAKKTTVAAAIDAYGGVNIRPVVDISNLGSGFQNPSHRRVQWFTMNLAMDIGSLDRSSGLVFVTAGGTLPNLWPVAPAAGFGRGLGIVGDGAGNWVWESYDGDAIPANVLETVALNVVAPDAIHTFDFVFISGTDTRQAVFQLWVDGELFLERDWVGVLGVALAPLPAAGNRWAPIWRVGTTSNENLYQQGYVYRMGRFLPDGRELFT